jgi:uncharacterized protein (UPF0216 family)
LAAVHVTVKRPVVDDVWSAESDVPLVFVIATFVAFAGVARQSVEVAVVVPALGNDELFVTTLNQYEVPAVRERVVLVPDVVVCNVTGLEVVP